MRFTELVENCEVGVPEEASASAVKGMSVMAKSCLSVVVLMLNNTKEPNGGDGCKEQ